MKIATRLYIELHITIEAGDDFQEFLTVCKYLNWKGSRFDQDEVDDYHGKWFMSDRLHKFSEVRPRLANAIAILEHKGYKVLRWKAEDTLLDSKYGDILP